MWEIKDITLSRRPLSPFLFLSNYNFLAIVYKYSALWSVYALAVEVVPTAVSIVSVVKRHNLYSCCCYGNLGKLCAQTTHVVGGAYGIGADFCRAIEILGCVANILAILEEYISTHLVVVVP